jgi:hypothetical protein
MLFSIMMLFLSVPGFAEGDVQVEILRERRHEAFNDLGREEVFDLVSSWMCRWKK